MFCRCLGPAVLARLHSLSDLLIALVTTTLMDSFTLTSVVLLRNPVCLRKWPSICSNQLTTGLLRRPMECTAHFALHSRTEDLYLS